MLFRCLLYCQVERRCRRCFRPGYWEITAASEARGRRSVQQTSLEVSVDGAVERAMRVTPPGQGRDRGWFLARPAVVASILLDELVVNSSAGHLSVYLRMLEPEAMPTPQEAANDVQGCARDAAEVPCPAQGDESAAEGAGTGGTATPAGSAAS